MTSNEKIDALKMKLKAANKQKLWKEREACKLRSLDRSLTEDLVISKDETEHLIEQIEEAKQEISRARHQISMIEICKASEKYKIEAQINELNAHKRGYEVMFEKEKQKASILAQQILEQEACQLETRVQHQLRMAQVNERHLLEAARVEGECDAVERECAVLKKRNTAIMLKLRKKLVETEDTRRELMKKLFEVDKNASNNNNV